MGKDKKLSEAEKEIMEIIWKKGEPCCAGDIFSAVENKEWKYTTVSTFLSRLVKKGFLETEKRVGQNFYKTKILHDEYLERETNEFIEEVYNGKAGELIASLCKSRISESDYGELMKLLEKYGEK